MPAKWVNEQRYSKESENTNRRNRQKGLVNDITEVISNAMNIDEKVFLSKVMTVFS